MRPTATTASNADVAGASAPILEALSADPRLGEHLRSAPQLTRVALCLFGDPGGVEDDQRAAGQLEPELIAGESPLSPLVLDHLQRAATPEELGEALLGVSLQFDRSPEERGDAIAGWAALGLGEGSPAPALGGLDGSDDPAGVAVRARVLSRLDRSLELAGRLLAQVPAGELVEAFGDGRDSHADWVLPALGALAEPRPGGFERPVKRATDSFVAAVAGRSRDDGHELALTLDAVEETLAGSDGSALPSWLATLHLAPSSTVLPRGGWSLDPCGPRSAPELGEALTNISAMPDQLASLRCRLLTRIATELVPAGYGEEAAALLLDAAGAEREAALRALHELELAGLDLGLDVTLLFTDSPGEATGEPAIPPELAEAFAAMREQLESGAAARVETDGRGEAEDGPDPVYPAVRGLLRLAASDGDKEATVGVSAIECIGDPISRVRAYELADRLGLDVGALREPAADWVQEIAWLPDRLLARARLFRGTGDEGAGDFLAAALGLAPEIEPEAERAEVLASVRDLVSAEPRARVAWQEAVCSLRSSRLRARARGRVAPELLDRERSEPGGEVHRPGTHVAAQPEGPALDVASMTGALQGNGEQVADALLAAAEGGPDGRHSIAVAIDVLGPDVGERAGDWLAALARINSSPELAGRANAVGWDVSPLHRSAESGAQWTAALAAGALARLPEELGFLDRALAARIALPGYLAVHWLARLSAAPDADGLGRLVVEQLKGHEDEAAGEAYAALWRAWGRTPGASEDQARQALDAVLAHAPFADAPWALARATLAAPRGRPPTGELIDLLERIEDPTELADALHAAAPVVDAGLGGSGELRERWKELGASALRRAEAIEDPDERLGAIALLGPALGPGAAGDQAALLAAEVERGESPLIPWAQQVSSRRPKSPLGWAALTLGAIARDGLAVLDGDAGRTEA